MYMGYTFDDNQKNANELNKLFAIESLDHAYVDPILFGYLFTCDSLDYGKYMFPFNVGTSNNPQAANFSPYKNWVVPHDYLDKMGKFKVTFYCKFRGLKANRTIPNINNARYNALGDTWILNQGYPILPGN